MSAPESRGPGLLEWGCCDGPIFGTAMDDGSVRLTQPLVRDAGRLRLASWDEALARAAEGLARAKAIGPNAFGLFICSKTPNALTFTTQKSTRAVMCLYNID